MYSLKSYLTPINNSEVKEVWNTISRLHPFHILNIQGGDSKRPMERKQGKQYIIYKWSHAIISEKAKSYQESKLLKRNKTYQSKISKSINFKLPKVPLRPWDETPILLSHKRALWDRGAWIKFRKKGKWRTQKN